jgi:CheY-like chemotaxis protein
MHILLLEDNQGAAAAMQTLLVSEGHVVRVASSLQEACDALVVWTPQLALVDIDLPDGSGWDLAAALKERCENPLPPCVAITARYTRSDAERSMQAGFHAHLVKPIQLAELRAVLDAL